MFIKSHSNYIHNIWFKRGYLDPKLTPTYLWRDVAYPGTRQAGYNHIPTRLIYEGMTWEIKKLLISKHHKVLVLV